MSADGSDPDLDVVQMHLAQAYSRALDPDVIRHLHAALRELDPDCPPGLVECPVCGRVGLPERIREHECGRGRAYNGP
jgi:hypothetical protein